MVHAGKALAAAGLLVALGSAGAPVTPAAAQEGVSAPVPDTAAIVNGIPTHLQPTTGALLFVGPDTRNQFLDCSGVLIGCRTVLTAAHCLCKASDNYEGCVAELPDLPQIDTSDLRFYFQHSGIHHVREIFIDPTFVEGVGGDLAMLRLSELVTGIEPARIHDTIPDGSIPLGTEGTIVGFGTTGDDRIDAAIKRVGTVVVDSCPVDSSIDEPANICWDFVAPILKPGDESNLCLADDGGPMFGDFGHGERIIGIHGGGGPTCDVDSFSYDTNVVRSREWIKSIGGPDVQRDQCDAEIGEVGEPWVLVQGGSGTLPKNLDEARFSFDVPKDSLLVRVTVNGDTAKDGDYDFFVGLGNKVPTRDINDCKVRGAGGFGACEFDEPDTGRVNILVRHVKPNVGRGKSRFQVTVTAWQEIPPREDPPRGPDNLRYKKRSTGYRTLLWYDDSTNEDGFELQRRLGTDPANPFVKRATIKADRESYLESIGDKSVYTYRIRAFNAWGVSEWSNICIVNKPRVRRPGLFRAEEVLPNSVTLRWKDRSDNEVLFEIQRRVSGALRWKTIKVLSPNKTSYVDQNVLDGENYEYRIRAKGQEDICIKNSLWSRIEVSTPLD